MSGPEIPYADDDLAAVILRDRGWRVESVPWQHRADWSAFDIVVIRTTWDYHQRPAHFLDALAAIDRSAARLHNPLPLVRWNLDKRYLADLAANDVPVVPTVFADHLRDWDALAAHFRTLDTPDLILKPQISASAHHTFRVSVQTVDAMWPRLQAAFADAPVMAQPFMPRIRDEGEYSLVYFNGAFSHAVRKTPAGGDFRVQEEYGGVNTAVSPEPALLAAGAQTMSALDDTPLYARVDLVRHLNGAFCVMELELIEPSLYLSLDPGAPHRFAAALEAVATG